MDETLVHGLFAVLLVTVPTTGCLEGPAREDGRANLECPLEFSWHDEGAFDALAAYSGKQNPSEETIPFRDKTGEGTGHVAVVGARQSPPPQTGSNSHPLEGILITILPENATPTEPVVRATLAEEHDQATVDSVFRSFAANISDLQDAELTNLSEEFWETRQYYQSVKSQEGERTDLYRYEHRVDATWNVTPVMPELPGVGDSGEGASSQMLVDSGSWSFPLRLGLLEYAPGNDTSIRVDALDRITARSEDAAKEGALPVSVKEALRELDLDEPPSVTAQQACPGVDVERPDDGRSPEQPK